MHLHQLVVAVQKQDGSTLRETLLHSLKAASSTSPTLLSMHKKSVVHLPFGSEYTLFFKNMSTERAIIGVEIDGTDVLGGNRLVVDGKSETHLERFVLDGNLEKGRKFKFVSLDSPDVQNPTADKNGLVRITAQWEAPRPAVRIIPLVVRQWGYDVNPQLPTMDAWEGRPITSGAVSMMNVNTAFVGNTVMEQACATFTPDSASAAQKGATVEGGDSAQRFHYTYAEQLTGPEIVMEFQIYAPAPIAVKEAPTATKRFCTQCRAPLAQRDRFCGSCGEPVNKG